MRGKSEKTSRRAAIVAGDEALRDSLTLLLQIAGFDTASFADTKTLISAIRLDEEFMFVDATLATGTSAFAELRKQGWRGTAVVMIEGFTKHDNTLADPRSRVLVKPFSAAEVLALLSS